MAGRSSPSSVPAPLREGRSALLLSAAAVGGAAVTLAAVWARRVHAQRHALHPCGLSMRTARALAKHRAGRLHVFERLPARGTALVVIDMQETFLSEANRDMAFFCPEGRAIVPAINRAAEDLRRRGGRVVWITSDVGPDSLESWSTLYGSFLPAALRPELERSLADDALRWGEEYDAKRCRHGMDGPLDPGLDLRLEDLIIKKDRFSPFAPGGGRHQGVAPSDGPVGPLDFAERLRCEGVEVLLLAGVTTACCVEGAVRDAMQQNFKVVVLSDACAASQLQDHVASLDHLAYLMADVRTVDDALRVLSD